MTAKQVFGTSHVPLSPAVRAGDLSMSRARCRAMPTAPSRRRHRGADPAGARKRQGRTRARRRDAGPSRQDHGVLDDARDFGGINKVYASYFAKEPPARTTAEGRLMLDIKVEIEAVAYAA